MVLFGDKEIINSREQLTEDDRIIVVLQSKIDNSISEITFSMKELGSVAHAIKTMLKSARYKNHSIRKIYSFKLCSVDENKNLDIMHPNEVEYIERGCTDKM